MQTVEQHLRTHAPRPKGPQDLRVCRIVFLPGSEHFDPVAIHTVMVSGKEEKQCNFRKGKALWSPTRPMDLERGIDADYPQYLV